MTRATKNIVMQTFLVLFVVASFSAFSKSYGQAYMCNYSCSSSEVCEYSYDVGFHCVCYGQGCTSTGITQCPPGQIPNWDAPTSFYCGRATAQWHRGAGCCALTQDPQECGDWYSCPRLPNNPGRMCRDCSQPEPYCRPYNARVEVGRCVPVPPPTLSLTGSVWEDLNGDNVLTTADRYWTTAAYPGASCRTAGQSAALNVAISGQSSAAPSWSCTNGAITYTTPAYSAGSRSFVLSPPNNYACSSVSWSYRVCSNAGCTASTTGSGTGCTATIPNYSGTFANSLNWRVNQVIPRTISGTTYRVTNPTTCASVGVLGVSSLTATAYNGAASLGSANVNVGTGAYSITSGITSTTSMSSVCINGSLVNGTQAYQLACVASTGLTCTRGSGACAVTCTPTSALLTGNVAVNFGFMPVLNEKWFGIVDGDFYADGVATSVAATPLGGFSPYLINTQSGTTIGGYGFTAESIDTDTAGTGVSEKGGSAENLSVLPSYPPTDQWLNKFSFSVPPTANTSVPSGNVFEEGEVYSFTVAQMNSILSTGTYRFAGGNSNAPAASIIYVTGSGTINITRNFVSANNNKTLLIVTAAPIAITKDPGTTVASMAVAGASQIDLVIISQGDMTFASQYNGTTFDNPLMIYGSLMSSGSISLNRNLGAINNSGYPATAIRFYPYLMGLIQKYEIENSTTGTYTGLSTVDVQFDYGE